MAAGKSREMYWSRRPQGSAGPAEAAAHQYHVQRAIDLSAGSEWTDMGPVITDASGQGEFVDSNAPAGQAFYRIARPQ